MKSATLLLFQWSLLIFFASVSSASHPKFPMSGPLLAMSLRDPIEKPLKSISLDYKTFFYDQTLDHFNFNPDSYTTFKQRYFINSKFWGGAESNSPIFAYLGAEASIDNDLRIVGFLTDNASRFKSLLLYIEHRYYGESVPFGKQEEALQNSTIRGYFNSAQALADYAELLLHIKKNLSAPDSPIVVFGASYGGMLASWFRLKYPHIAISALASSAPILYFDNITAQDGYYSVVTKDFKDCSQSCYETILKSWSEIDKIAAKPNGLTILSEKFNTCKALNSSFELKDYLDSMYSNAAQYSLPPYYPVAFVCRGIDGASNGTDILGRIFAGVVAYFGNRSCYDTNFYNRPTETSIGFSWQTCSEMVMPIGHGVENTMFPVAPFNLSSFIEDCKRKYGVTPRPHWITTYYGGHNIKKVLRNFASNIIFSNGLMDPYSTAGVLEDISETVVALTTKNGSHCLDLLPALVVDPQWLTEQRKQEVQIIEGWLLKYYDGTNMF